MKSCPVAPIQRLSCPGDTYPIPCYMDFTVFTKCRIWIFEEHHINIKHQHTDIKFQSLKHCLGAKTEEFLG